MNSSAHPVVTLREHGAALEAAVEVCLAKPTRKAVHRVRTESRRIEAQLDLLAMTPGLPPSRTEAAEVRAEVKELRQAAGRVRDPDVQRKLLKAYTLGSKKGVEVDKVQDGVAELRELLKKRRKKAAKKLLGVLKKHGPKVAGALEALLAALEPAEGAALSAIEVRKLAEGHFRRQPALDRRDRDEEQMHAIRKAAKLTRYQEESVAGSKTAARAAARYKRLQDEGGAWHDWLSLAELAAKKLGKKHPLSGRLAVERERSLERYAEDLGRVLNRGKTGSQRRIREMA